MEDINMTAMRNLYLDLHVMVVNNEILELGM